MDFVTVARLVARPERGAEVAQVCRDLLGEIVDGRRKILGVRHPLGFLCIPVIRGDTDGVCVHVWGAAFRQAQSTTSQIHSHSWDLLSYVLYGQVGNVELSIQDSDRDATHRIFEVRSQDGVDEISATQRLVHCREIRREVVGPGGTYRLEAGGFHRSFIVGSDAATLVLGRTKPATDLSLGPPQTGSHLVTRQLCTIDDTRAAAQVVIGRLRP